MAAAQVCVDAAQLYNRDVDNVFKTSTAFEMLAILGTALGTTTIPAHAAWAALGGTSGITAAWKTESDARNQTDQQRLRAVNAAADSIAGLSNGNPSTLTEKSLAAAIKCAAGMSITTDTGSGTTTTIDNTQTTTTTKSSTTAETPAIKMAPPTVISTGSQSAIVSIIVPTGLDMKIATYSIKAYPASSTANIVNIPFQASEKYTINNLVSGQQYTFTVSAWDAKGNALLGESAKSATPTLIP
jgi:hypothetical protein